MNITLWVTRIGTGIAWLGSLLAGVYFLLYGPDMQARIMGTLSSWALTVILSVFVWNDFKKIKSS